MDQLADDLGSSRVRRVAEALVILCILGALDLICTIFANQYSHMFYEANPLARALLVSHGVAGLVLTKVIFLGIGVAIFWRLRRNARAELAVWGLVLLHVLLLIQWTQYAAIVHPALQ